MARARATWGWPRRLHDLIRDIPIEAKPEGPRDPLGRIIETKPRTWKYLTEMSLDEFMATRKKERNGIRI